MTHPLLMTQRVVLAQHSWAASPPPHDDCLGGEAGCPTCQRRELMTGEIDYLLRDVLRLLGAARWAEAGWWFSEACDLEGAVLQAFPDEFARCSPMLEDMLALASPPGTHGTTGCHGTVVS